MNTHADKTQETQSQSVANAVSPKQSISKSTFQFVDNRPVAMAQRKLQEMANNSPQAKKAAQLQAMANGYAMQYQQPFQKKNSPPSRIENTIGLPDNLKLNSDPVLENETELIMAGARESNSIKGGQSTNFSINNYGNDSAITQRQPIQLQVDKETEDGHWIFSDYALQTGKWTGLKENTLTYLPKTGADTKKISLIQVVQTLAGDQFMIPPGYEKRTNGSGFRVDNFLESNNPIFGADKAKKIDDTPLSDDTFKIGLARNTGTERRPNVEQTSASRLDNPGIAKSFIDDNGLQDESMGQILITAAYNMETGGYLGSIGYGWHKNKGEEPALIEMSYTTGGVSEIFISAVKQWNSIKGNIHIPTPEAVEVKGFEEDDEDELVMDNDSEELTNMNVSLSAWINDIKMKFHIEYAESDVEWGDFDAPFAPEYEDGMTSISFYNKYIKDWAFF